ncbi:MAG TPA: hypothetical protein DGD08_09915 [Gemmatimonas aurantiaca]|nr:hypothetical protein [Gemmatimonas aurantiaca]
MARVLMRSLAPALAAGAFALLVPLTAVNAQAAGSTQPPQSAEQRLRLQQTELDKLRRERGDLEARMNELQRSARTLTEEVNNLEAQRQTTRRLVEALDRQLGTINEEVTKAGSGLVKAERELGDKRSALQRRMVEIYKRGSLYDVEAMLSAHSFASLVARYKYLHELALRDRNLVRRVEGLRDQIINQRMLLVRLQDDVERNRQEKTREARRLSDLENRRQRNLVAVQKSTAQTRARLQQLARDESRIAGAIAALETARRRAEMAPNARPSAPSSIRTSDLGKLDWPVDGTILYRFGRVVNANNTTTRWNGIGIGANTGSAVKSISAGEVVLADNVGTYGPTVIVQHGGGDYSVYGSLQRIDVRKGQQVTKGQVLGTVGDTDPELPPHLHFEIRPKGRAVDPLEWLRGQR